MAVSHEPSHGASRAVAPEPVGGGRQVLDAICVGALTLLMFLAANAIAKTHGPTPKASANAADCDKPAPPPPTVAGGLPGTLAGCDAGSTAPSAPPARTTHPQH